MARRLTEHRAHSGPGPGTSRQPVGPAGPEPGREHRDGQDQKEQRTDLPDLMREQRLCCERYQERAERPRGSDDAEHSAAPRLWNRAGNSGQSE
jgi:hypothetical protein